MDTIESWLATKKQPVLLPRTEFELCSWIASYLRDNGHLPSPSLSVDEAVSIKSITLEGEQPDPAGTITVTVQLSDGAEVEAIRTCANNIYHMVTVEGILTERLTKATTRS